MKTVVECEEGLEMGRPPNVAAEGGRCQKIYMDFIWAVYGRGVDMV